MERSRSYTDVPSLREEYAQHEQEEEGAGAGPSIRGVGNGLVEILLVDLARIRSAAVLARTGSMRLWYFNASHIVLLLRSRENILGQSCCTGC